MRDRSLKIFLFWITLVLILVGLNTPVTAADYYVSTAGNNDNPGTEALPWQTVTYAATQAQGSDVVHIKSGNYGHEHVVVTHSGTTGSPVTFEGYDGTVEFDGADQTGNGIYLSAKNYVSLRNISLRNYANGIRAESSGHLVIDNLTFEHMGTDSPWTGDGFSFANVSYSTLTHCNAGHCNIHNLYFSNGSYNTVENCNFFIDSGDTLSADYGVYTENSRDNTFNNCVIENRKPLAPGHHGHGIALRWTSYNNQITNCRSYGLLEHWIVGETGYNNVFENCIAEDQGAYSTLNLYTHALVSRMGAHHNRFTQCKSLGVRHGISLWTDSTTLQKDNRYENCVVEGAQYAIYLNKASNNTFINCLILNSAYLFLTANDVSNVLHSSIVQDVGHYALVGGSWTTPTVSLNYCDFWANGFSPISGTENLAVDPLFADAAQGDYHLKSQYGRWNDSAWVYDTETSPCVDAGDPALAYIREPEPNGGRINMGIYGGTTCASKSSHPAPQTLAAGSGIRVFPNPYIAEKSSLPTVRFQNLPQNATIKIYTPAGVLIQTLQHHAAADKGSENWDVSQLAGGVYLYRVSYSGGGTSGKISVLK